MKIIEFFLSDFKWYRKLYEPKYTWINIRGEWNYLGKFSIWVKVKPDVADEVLRLLEEKGWKKQVN